MEVYRNACLVCRKPKVTCICHQVCPFTPEPIFVILIHPKELKIKSNSGRMAHLCLNNSMLIDGICFDDDSKVNALIADDTKSCFLLHPGYGATNITSAAHTKDDKQKVYFVLDATWFLARKMYKLSRVLQAMPKVEITPTTPSRFLIKKQPREGFLSTIEAIHLVIDHTYRGDPPGPHQNLIDVFDYMVAQQAEYARRYRQVRRSQIND